MKFEVVVPVGIAVVLLLIGLGWALTENDVAMDRHFSPQREEVRRETFEQSKAYRQGLVQELQNMQFQYEQADPAHKVALADIILRRAADVDPDTLPPSLRQFTSQLRLTRGR